jgi:hypothetical protein
MARMPGAVWKPIPASSSKISSFDIVCIHTMVGSLAGTDGYFRKIAPGVNSHFGTGEGGEIWQWVDTAYRSGANLNGNHRVISIENADMGAAFGPWNTKDGGAVPAFTPSQIEANAQILAWAHKTHGIPLELITDSKPGRRGVAYHSLGVPATKGATASRTGGELWSTAVGKVCPGNRRIAQIPQIIARAKQIAGGAPAVSIATEEDMPLTDADIQKIWSYAPIVKQATMADRIVGIDAKDPNAVAQAVWNFPVAGTFAQHRLKGVDDKTSDDLNLTRAQQAAIDGLVKLVAEQNGLTVEDVRRVVSEEVAKGVDVDVKVQGRSAV